MLKRMLGEPQSVAESSFIWSGPSAFYVGEFRSLLADIDASEAKREQVKDKLKVVPF